MNKGLTMKSGQTHMQRYLRPLLQKIETGEIDPSFVITHTVPLAKAPEMSESVFRKPSFGMLVNRLACVS
jgi:threonine dehydrogenase-like Zn-dependent dehydrogenase